MKEAITGLWPLLIIVVYFLLGLWGGFREQFDWLP